MVKLKKTIVRMILLILLGSTFFMIFQFSSENSEASGSRSREVMRKIVNTFPYTKNLNEKTKIKIVEKSQPIIRKLAHFLVYTLVGILIMAFMSTFETILLKKFMISLFIGLIYAITDEYHQSFTPGRSPEIRDICIDTAGVFLGIILVLVIISVFKALTEGIKKKKVET